MSGTSFPYDMAPAYPGMIADSMHDHKETFRATSAIPFGVVFGTNGNDEAFLPVGSTPGGLTIHDHIIDGRGVYGVQGQYATGDAVSGMRRGKVWCRASGACTNGAVAKYNATTGLFGDAEAATLVNARFRSANITVIGIQPADATFTIVKVEMHNPMT